MKKVFGILLFFLGLGFVVCLITGFCVALPEEVPVYGAKTYKFCTGLSYFLQFLPAMIFTGFAVGFSVYFGHNCEGCYKRFSPAILKKFEMVMIISIIGVALLTLANETFGLMINKKKAEIVNRPKIINEYLKVGNDFYDQGFYSRAARYADAVLTLEPNSVEGNELKNKTDIILKSEYVPTPKIDASTAKVIEEEKIDLKIDEQKISEAFSYLKKAREAFEKSKWFDAHYYAELGVKITSSKDPNLDELKRISSQAWNNVTSEYQDAKTQAQIDFQEKCNGYFALMQNDDLRAYYIFKSLSEKSKELSRDPDVLFYLDIAKKRVEEKYFFIDETLELTSFESSTDVYFSYKNPNGTESIFFFKGMTIVESTGFSVQYLRDLSIVTLDAKGNWRKTVTVPYAKVIPVAVSNFDEKTRTDLGIDENAEYVPYILLKSVGRTDEKQIFSPKYSFAEGIKEETPDSILYPISFEDFTMIENSTGNPNTIPLVTLFKLVFSASEYGYSQELYGQNLLNRLLYPLYILFILVCMATFGWNNRIGENQYFKFSWVFSFPLMIIGEYLFNLIIMFVFRIMNYVLLGFVGAAGALFAGIGIYILALVIASVFFLSRKTGQ